MEKTTHPKKDYCEYYGNTYSVPVVAFDPNGEVLPYMVRWHFPANGWVIATLPDGPSPSDYEIMDEVTNWMDPAIRY